MQEDADKPSELTMQVSFAEINNLRVAENSIVLHCRPVATSSNESGRLEAGMLRSLRETAAAERKVRKAKSGG